MILLADESVMEKDTTVRNEILENLKQITLTLNYSYLCIMVSSDSFLERVSAANQAAGKSRPVTIGIAFDEQILEDSIIPMDPHDKVLDFVITPTSAYTTLK